jgi:hypothetical protein
VDLLALAAAIGAACLAARLAALVVAAIVAVDRLCFCGGGLGKSGDGENGSE